MRLMTGSMPSGELVLEAHGWISGEDVDLLRRVGERLLRQNGRLVLALGGVRFIDRDGLDLLKHWEGLDVSFSGCTGFVRALLEHNGLICS